MTLRAVADSWKDVHLVHLVGKRMRDFKDVETIEEFLLGNALLSERS